MSYIFHTDPGHGWLAVPKAELRALHIEDQISHYSYQSHDGATAYLEEDCDLSVFARAAWNCSQDPPIKDAAADGGWIRNLPRYRVRS